MMLLTIRDNQENVHNFNFIQISKMIQQRLLQMFKDYFLHPEYSKF